MKNTNAKKMIEEKLQASGLPMAYILQEVGLKQEATLWKQIEDRTITADKVQRLSSILHLRQEELRLFFAA